MRLRINRDGVFMSLGCAFIALLFLLMSQLLVLIAMVRAT